MNRKEILRRLGVPQFRCRCPQCGRYVPSLHTAFDWSEPGNMRKVSVCDRCVEYIEKRNKERTKERVSNGFAYQRANEEYRAAQQRASSREYLAACERMKRELGLK